MYTAISTTSTEATTYIDDTSERTSSTGRANYVRVNRVELGRSHLQLIAPNIGNRTLEWFQRAQASGRERDWEQFVQQTTRLAESPRERATLDEVMTLWSLASTVSSSYRPAAALVRAVSAFVSSPAWVFYASYALTTLIRHPSPEVRLQALEAAEDADLKLAKQLAVIAVDDPHPDIREAAAAIRALP